ncbi:2Fe-2S iron-sulfur cluster-binding protein [candidate division KSB1 bacterium]
MAEKKDDKKRLLSRRNFLKGVSRGAVTAAVIPASVTSAKAKKDVSDENVGIEKGTVNLIVNGKSYKLEVEARETLADTLRKRLNLTGTKIMCNQGSCGACTVHLDGVPVYSCLILTMEVNNRKISTIEDLSSDGKLHPVQEAFIEKDGLQCGFCTPGQIMAATALLKKNTNPTLEEVKHGMSGNLCRCGAYPKIFESVLTAAEKGRR